jgi:hypothetical protein
MLYIYIFIPIYKRHMNPKHHHLSTDFTMSAHIKSDPQYNSRKYIII